MKISVHDRSELLSPAIEEKLVGRIERAFSRLEKQFRELTWTFEDINGERGGEDKHVKVTATLDTGATLVVESTALEIETVVDEICRRLKHASVRKHERARKKRRAHISLSDAAESTQAD